MSPSSLPSVQSQQDTNKSPAPQTCRPACPVCGGELMDIKHKLICSRCRTICETCCEGGRG